MGPVIPLILLGVVLVAVGVAICVLLQRDYVQEAEGIEALARDGGLDSDSESDALINHSVDSAMVHKELSAGGGSSLGRASAPAVLTVRDGSGSEGSRVVPSFRDLADRTTGTTPVGIGTPIPAMTPVAGGTTSPVLYHRRSADPVPSLARAIKPHTHACTHTHTSRGEKESLFSVGCAPDGLSAGGWPAKGLGREPPPHTGLHAVFPDRSQTQLLTSSRTSPTELGVRHAPSTGRTPMHLRYTSGSAADASTESIAEAARVLASADLVGRPRLMIHRHPHNRPPGIDVTETLSSRSIRSPIPHYERSMHSPLESPSLLSPVGNGLLDRHMSSHSPDDLLTADI